VVLIGITESFAGPICHSTDLCHIKSLMQKSGREISSLT